MWNTHQQGLYDDLDRLLEPMIVGRLLDVGGFVLADPFETILQYLSEGYLRSAWHNLSSALDRYEVIASDLSWGWLHPGETHLSGMDYFAPSALVGWSSQQLADFDHDPRFRIIDAELRLSQPAITCACTWRSRKWRIAPDDFASGLRLVEGLSTSEVSDWAPEYIIRESRSPYGAWHAIASAILAEDQHALDQALVLAQNTYSPIGYRIVLDGYASYLGQNGIESAITFPGI